MKSEKNIRTTIHSLKIIQENAKLNNDVKLYQEVTFKIIALKWVLDENKNIL